MTIYYVDSNASTIWTTGATVIVGAMYSPTYSRTAAQRGYVYECTAITTGLTAATEPTWPTTAAATVVDGGVTWTVRDGISTGGWAKAIRSIAHIFSRQGTFSPLATGDKIFVASGHSEGATAALSWGANATDDMSLEVMSVNTGTNAYQRGATVSSSNGIAITMRSSALFRGIDFTCGAGNASAAAFNIGSSAARETNRFDDCTFYLNNTSASSLIGTSGVAAVTVEFNNCTFRFGAVGQKFTFTTGYDFVLRSCRMHASSSAVTQVFDMATAGSLRSYGCDWTGASSSAKLVDGSAAGAYSYCYFDDCKLPSSYATPTGTTSWIRLITRGCSPRYATTVKEQFFTLTTDTATYRNTVDGATHYSWKIVTGTGTLGDLFGRTEWRAVYIGSTGSKTITVDTLYDAAAGLKDSEAWIEVDYLGTVGEVYTSSGSDWGIHPGTTQTSGTAGDWTKAAAVTGWNAQKLAVTVTVNVIGYLRYRVCTCKASTTFYVDPKAQVS